MKDLTYKNIDYTYHLLKFEQNKTKGHSANSGVVIPLNDGLLSLIGKAPEDLETSIFNLPTYETSRHSFAVNILNNGANIKTVASLLGHSGLKHTEKYTRAVDKLKSEAINSLPELKL